MEIFPTRSGIATHPDFGVGKNEHSTGRKTLRCRDARRCRRPRNRRRH
jgi:hypothetical protein